MATGDKYIGEWEGGKKNGKGKIVFIQVIIHLLMGMSMKESLKMEIGKDKVLTRGLIKAITKDNGLLIK